MEIHRDGIDAAINAGQNGMRQSARNNLIASTIAHEIGHHNIGGFVHGDEPRDAKFAITRFKAKLQNRAAGSHAKTLEIHGNPATWL